MKRKLQSRVLISLILLGPSLHAANTYPERRLKEAQGSAMDQVLEQNPEGSVAKATGFTIELNDGEKRVFRNDPLIALTARDAVRISEKFVMDTCGAHSDQTEANALLHFMIACYASYNQGIARAFPMMLAHEENGLVDQNFESLPSNPNLRPLPENRWQKTSRMDIYNNEMGLFCGEYVRAAMEKTEPRYQLTLAVQEMKRLALISLSKGQLSYLKNIEKGPCRRGPPNSLHERIPRYIGDYEPFSSILKEKDLFQ